MEETGLPNTMEEAVHLIRNPPFEEAGGQYAFVGKVVGGQTLGYPVKFFKMSTH